MQQIKLIDGPAAGYIILWTGETTQLVTVDGTPHAYTNLSRNPLIKDIRYDPPTPKAD